MECSAGLHRESGNFMPLAFPRRDKSKELTGIGTARIVKAAGYDDAHETMAPALHAMANEGPHDRLHA